MYLGFESSAFKRRFRLQEISLKFKKFRKFKNLCQKNLIFITKTMRFYISLINNINTVFILVITTWAYYFLPHVLTKIRKNNQPYKKLLTNFCKELHTALYCLRLLRLTTNDQFLVLLSPILYNIIFGKNVAKKTLL